MLLLWEVINSRAWPDHLGSSPYLIVKLTQTTSEQLA